MTLRLAFVGKGGSGKSTIAGTLARLLARRGEPVLAVDSDPMPGLAYSLGLPVDDAPIPDDAVVERPEGDDGPRFRLRPGLSAEQAISDYAVRGGDGVAFLQFGNLSGHVRDVFRSQLAFRQIVRNLPTDRWHLIGDLPGGTRQAFNGWGDYADTFLVVVEPSVKSLLSARRLAGLARTDAGPRVLAVANRTREPGDADTVARRTGLPVLAAIPFDPAVAEAERSGRAVIDEAPDCAAVRAIGSLLDLLVKEVAGEAGSRR